MTTWIEIVMEDTINCLINIDIPIKDKAKKNLLMFSK